MRSLCCWWLVALALAGLDAGATPMTATDLNLARKLYVTQCAKCHRFYEPSDYPDDAWRRWMEKMNRKSNLAPKQAGLLTRYLEAYRAGELSGEPHEKPKVRRPNR